MDKIKRFLECHIATETCNLRCHYCYITQQRKFNSKIAAFKYSPEVIRKAFSQERMGGICFMDLCAGGETLLSQDVLPVVKALLEEGHYIQIVTNGTLTKRFKEIAIWPSELLNRLFFKFSFHFLEFKRRNLMDVFFNNVRMMRDCGCSFTIEATPSDELIPYIEEMKQVSLDNVGALPHITVARNERTFHIKPLTSLDWEIYKKTWSVFDSKMFEFKSQIFSEPRKEFCYAGEWSAFVNMNTGMVLQCYCGMPLGNIYKNLDKPFNFIPIGYGCGQPHCYNGHGTLCFGDIPEMDSPTYADMRNRITPDGSEWLMPDMKQIMSQKLKDNNKVYDTKEKVKKSVYLPLIYGAEAIYHVRHTLRPIINNMKKPTPGKENVEKK